MKNSTSISSLISSISDNFRDPKTSSQVGLLVITHLLRDRPEFLNGLTKTGFEVSVLSIPYSEIPKLRTFVDPQILIIEPQSVWPPTYDTVKSIVDELLSKCSNFIVLDIGGYCSTFTRMFKEQYGHRFIGIVEDTEAGFRRYSEQPELYCPVVSVARSPLKECEDVLVGTSIVSSVDVVMRSIERPLKGLQVLVIGFGKIGRSVAMELWHRGNYVLVLDSNPIRRALAMAMGYATPDRSQALQSCDIIIGVTGKTSVLISDLNEIRNGCILVSGSSRNIEFEVALGEQIGSMTSSLEGTSHTISEIPIDNKKVFLIDKGTPVNFPDAAVIGRPLQLAQLEMVCAVFKLIKGDFNSSGIVELSQADRELVAETWTHLQVN